MAAKKSREICRNCGESRVVPIVYGEPGPEMIRQAEKRQLVLGGSVMTEDSPRWTCRACGAEWIDHSSMLEEDGSEL
jgi:5-methylcytosine-specific restriction enzyme A